MKNKLNITCITILCFLALNSLNAQVVTLIPVKDNTMYSEAVWSNGKGFYLFSGITKNGDERRALLKFDLSSVQNTDSVVSATLQLHMSKTISGSQNVQLFRLNADWGEGASDAINEEGIGANPATNDATWNFSFYNTQLWTNPGGDFSNLPSASLIVGDTGTYLWNDPKLSDDIRNWIDLPQSNFGWIMVVDGTGTTAKRFDSKDNPVNKPKLMLEIESALGIQPSLNQEFKLFPNPSYGEFFIRFNNKYSTNEIKITDIYGRPLLNESGYFTGGSNGVHQINIKEKGIYFIQINNKDFSKVIIL